MEQAKLISVILFFAFCAPSPGLRGAVQQGPAPRAEFSAPGEERRPLSVTYEGGDDKAWDGAKYVKGVLLRARNTSDCPILFEVPSHEVRVHKFRDGKFVDVETDEAEDGQRLSIKYLMKYPNRESMVLGGFGGHLLEYMWLRGGKSVLFSVPLKNFKKGGELLVPYRYEPCGGPGTGAQPTVDQSVRFDGRRLIPQKMLR